MIATEVMRMTVTVIFAIGLVMPLLVTDQVIQGKTIVGSDEINTRLWWSATGFKDVG